MPAARPNRRILICLGFVAACVVGLGGPGAQADEALGAALEAQLRSPLIAVRRAAIQRAVDAGEPGRAVARAWRAAEDGRLRGAGWSILAQIGEAPDLAAALRGLEDPQPAVAVEAARAVLALAVRLPLEGEPWLPTGALAPRAARPLALALAETFEDAPRSGVAAATTRLGEGLLGALRCVLEHPRFGALERQGALRAVAAIGGEDARVLLSDVGPALDGERDWRLAAAWWQAVAEVGAGRGLEGAQDRAVALARASSDPRGRSGTRIPWWMGRYYYRFLGACPPAEGLAAVRGHLRGLIARAADSTRWRLYPSVAGDIVRAYLIVAEPTDESLRECVLAAQARPSRSWQRRIEELGEVLLHLEPYRERRGVREGAAELLLASDLPRSVRAWARYLQGDASAEALRAEATELIEAGGAAATLAQRRLGAQLLGRLGPPPVDRIRALRDDVDGWMRAQALSWAAQAVREKRMGAEEQEAALTAALADLDDGVFLVAAELRRGGLDRAQRARILDLAVRGRRALRARSWRVVGACLGPPQEGSAAPPLPRGHTPLDERLRAAARVQAAWGR